MFIAAAIPQIGPFTSLVGAISLGFLGLVFPPIIETVVYWNRPTKSWRLWKNMCLFIFGIIGFVTGTFVSIKEIIEAAH